MFQNGVQAVRDFMDEFGSDILKGLQRGFQAFKDIGVIVGEAISRIIEFIRNNKILAKLFGDVTDAGGGFLDKLNDIANGIREENEAEKKANETRQKMIDRFTKSETVTENLADATGDLTSEIEDNTDAVEDQADEIQFGAVEFDKYTKSIKTALSSKKTLTGLQEKGKREEARLEEATGELEEANIKVAKAQQDLANAQDMANRSKKIGTHISEEEELQILRLQEAVDKLTDAQDGSREKELQLIIAKRELAEATSQATEVDQVHFDHLKKVERAEEELQKAIEDQKKAREDQIKAKEDLAEATKVSAENLLTEALAVKELEKAFGSFDAGTFKATLEEIAKLTGRKIAEIEEAFKNAGLTEGSFSVPDGTDSGGDVIDAPTFEETGNENNNQGGSQGGSVQPIKIFTTLNIGSEKFETVTQDALISLQKQGKKVLL